MSRSIDVRIAKPSNLDEHKFQKVLNIVESALEKNYPSAIVRVRKSTSMSDVSVFGLGKEGKQNVSEFLEELFNNSYLFEDL